MAEDIVTTTGIARHGATRLPSVEVDSFNIELKDDEGFQDPGQPAQAAQEERR